MIWGWNVAYGKIHSHPNSFVMLSQALVTATGSTDSFIQNSSSLLTNDSRSAEVDSDALSVPDNDILDASIVSDDEEFAEGYAPKFCSHG